MWFYPMSYMFSGDECYQFLVYWFIINLINVDMRLYQFDWLE